MFSFFAIQLLVVVLQLPITIFECLLTLFGKGTIEFEVKRFKASAKWIALKMNILLV
jgi:hypothetical protein